MPAPPPADKLRLLLFLAGRQAARDALFLAAADSGASPDDPAFAEADRFLAEAPAPELPVSGSVLIARGVEEGPRVGEVLRIFRRRWIEASFPSDQQTLERLVEAAIADAKPFSCRPEANHKSTS